MCQALSEVLGLIVSKWRLLYQLASDRTLSVRRCLDDRHILCDCLLRTIRRAMQLGWLCRAEEWFYPCFDSAIIVSPGLLS